MKNKTIIQNLDDCSVEIFDDHTRGNKLREALCIKTFSKRIVMMKIYSLAKYWRRGGAFSHNPGEIDFEGYRIHQAGGGIGFYGMISLAEFEDHFIWLDELKNQRSTKR